MLQFDRVELDDQSDALRHEVRNSSLLTKTIYRAPIRFVTSHDAEFSAKLGAQGWIGMTWPSQYGGGEKVILRVL